MTVAKTTGAGSPAIGTNVLHRTDRSLLLCYVDHHDAAYGWAERRKLETHASTGAAQLVEIRERVQEIIVPAYVPASPAVTVADPLFAHLTNEELLGVGVPPEWIEDVRAATDDTILRLVDHLPAEAAEALLEVATGGTPRPRAPAAPVADPFEHPDAQRRFRVVSDVDELARALEYPWERWIVFLHPAQRDRPAPLRRSRADRWLAGTGKTVVALHRAAHLARANPGARVLLTTFSEPLASALPIKLGRLIGAEPRIRERIDVDPLDTVAHRLHRRLVGPAEVASPETIRQLVGVAARDAKSTASPAFLFSEWADVVDAWQLGSWEAYRDVARLGRKTRLPERQRRNLWAIFDHVRAGLAERQLLTLPALYETVTSRLAEGTAAPYDVVVIDESQDVSVAQLRFVAALGRARPDALFFAGDLGQRIFQVPFSWKSLGVDIRGRSATVRINYRTSQPIRVGADRILSKQISDVDGNVEDRRATVSAFNRSAPVVRVLGNAGEESAAVSRWLAERTAEGVAPEEMAVLVRSDGEVSRATAAVETGGLTPSLLDESVKTQRDRVSVGTMHLSTGLEFRAVAVMACDDQVLPLQARIEAVTDEGDLEQVYETERHLLYVACTRARDHLRVTGVTPASEFLKDLGA